MGERESRWPAGLWRGLAVALTACTASHGSLADEWAHHDEHPPTLAQAHAHARTSAHRGNHLSALLGTTYHAGDQATTYGLDYEYRLGDLIGIGAVAEHAVAPVEATTLLAVADLHLWRELALQTGPGAEILHTAEAEATEASELRFVYRVGLLYELAYGRITLSPQVHYDLVPGSEGDSVVAALAIGFGF